MLDGSTTRIRRWQGWYWILGLLVAFAIDGIVPQAFAPYRQVFKRSAFAEEIREGGHFVLTLLIALLLWTLHKDRWRGALLLVMSGIASGAARAVIALAVGRVRPVVHIAPFEFHPFNFDPSNILHAHNLSFPSGHTTLAFAMAATLAYLVPQGRWMFFVGASLVAFERVGELAHYPSDVVAGALLGIVSFRLMQPVHRYVVGAIERALGRFWMRSGAAVMLNRTVD